MRSFIPITYVNIEHAGHRCFQLVSQSTMHHVPSTSRGIHISGASSPRGSSPLVASPDRKVCRCSTSFREIAAASSSPSSTPRKPSRCLAGVMLCACSCMTPACFRGTRCIDGGTVRCAIGYASSAIAVWRSARWTLARYVKQCTAVQYVLPDLRSVRSSSDTCKPRRVSAARGVQGAVRSGVRLATQALRWRCGDLLGGPWRGM